MPLIELHREEYISIHQDTDGDWLYVNWIGYQSTASVKSGCKRMLQLMVETQIFDIINDNTLVVGIWSGAAE
ncbi:MAG TPA: hypothetical protein VF719_09960, partial [Abditibacteriaceae bacterium]